MILKCLHFPQVWFQNARAKFRRNIMRQDGSGQPQNLAPGMHNPMNTPGMHTPNSSNESDVTPSHALEDMHNMTFAELY
jgi:hypothetical protein